ncbi:hypothetical protein [Coleofasciculus sp. FACHB-T130]|uniref:hypothetical protein n=2 Tax=Cyanophyceae TaxID=3028117 RepID=UPI001683A3E3|nr:hypothetical protein [Coleofasciculus sp. FACHB-T130]
MRNYRPELNPQERPMSHDNPDAPQPLSERDRALAKELAAVRAQRQRLYEKLNGSLKALFSHCEWRITHHDTGMTELVVICPSLVIYQRLLKKVISIQTRLEDTVEIKQTRFILSYPPNPQAFYEHEVTIQQGLNPNTYLDGDENEEF